MNETKLIMFGTGGREAPIFCEDCGRKMVRETYRSGFDGRTGEKVYYTSLKCPRIFPHRRYEFNQHGFEVIQSYGY